MRRVMPATMERTLFAGLLAVAAIPLLAFGYFPSEDGPAHVANATVLFSSPASITAEYYDIDVSSGTNLLADVLLAGMLTFLSAAVADRAMALLLLVAMPLSVRWCLRQIDPDAAWMSILVIPLGGGFLLYFGLYSFLLGAILSFVGFGFWLKLIRSVPRDRIAGAAFVGIAPLVYLSHPLPFLALLLLVGATILDAALTRARTRGGRIIGASAPLLLSGALLAVAVVTIVFHLVFGAGRSMDIGYSRSFVTRIAAFPLDPVLALTALEIPFALMSTGAIALIGGVALVRGWASASKAPGFPLAVLALGIIYFLGPDSVGEGSMILPRTELYLLVLMLFAAAGQRLPRRAATTAIALTSLATLGLTVVRFPVHSEEDALIREYLSGADAVAPGSTVLPLWATEQTSSSGAVGRRVRPLIERAGYLASGRGAVDLHHFPGHLTIFPIRFAPGYGIGMPSSAVGETDRDSFELGPHVVDLENYETSGPGRVDYVWLWGRVSADSARMAQPRTRQILRFLENHYDLVHVSSPGGLLEVYARAD